MNGPGAPDQQRSPESRGTFLVTVDTEGDNLWSRPRAITTHNADDLPRFQELCERYGLKPTYLTNWEMVRSDRFVEFAKSILERGTGEIGMHLHAWNSPPLEPLTDDDFRYQPYLIDYPEALVREKVRVMTDTLESTFGVKMRSHRAGRWGLDKTYVHVLIEAGYVVDCTVTPGIDWSSTLGDPTGGGGPDYRTYPQSAYFMDPSDIARAGSSRLLQVPVTILRTHEAAPARALRATAGRIPYARRLVHRAVPEYSWLRPTGRNGTELSRIVALAEQQGRDYVEMMIHSSELMAGGSPSFPSRTSIEALYDDLEALFAASRGSWVGRTMSEYRELFRVPQVGVAAGTGGS